MYFELSDKQIENIKSINFEQVYLKKASLRRTNDKYFLDIETQINDTTVDGTKILNTDFLDKVKVKIFYILSDNMKSDISLCKNIFDLEDVIKKYKTVETHFYPSINYHGDRNNKQQLLNSGKFLLKFENTISLPADCRKYISIGLVMYYSTARPSNNNFNLSILSGDLYMYDLLKDNVDISNGILRDFSLPEEIFMNNKKINSLIEQINLNKNKKIADYSKIKDNEISSFFSRPYSYISNNNNLNIFFNFDYNNFIKYISSNIISDSKSKLLDLVKAVEIKNYRIIRKSFSKRSANHVAESEICIYSSDTNSTDNASVTQHTLFKNFLTYQITDKKAFNDENLSYQYGVEFTISNNIYSFLIDLKNNLLEQKKIFVDYLNETNSGTEYNFLYDCFGQDFILNKFDQVYSKKIYDSVDNLVETLKYFDIVDNTVHLSNSLKSLIRPSVANNDSISKLISIFDRVIEYVNFYSKSTKNSNIKLSKWLKFEDLEDYYVKNSGYMFFEESNKEIEIYNSNLLIESFLDSLKLLSTNEGVRPENQNILPICLSPKNININGQKNTFSSDLKFSVKEFEIKKQKKIFDKNEIVINNLKIENEDNLNNTLEENKEIFLSLYRKNLFTKIPTITEIEYTETTNELIPEQIRALLTGEGKYFNARNRDDFYISDSDLISKFLFLYNSLHIVEYLDPELENVNDTSWKVLTKDRIQKLSSINIENILCRLRLYENNSAKINNFDEIKLPVYNKYFLLNNNSNVNLSDISINTVIKTVTCDKKIGRGSTGEIGIISLLGTGFFGSIDDMKVEVSESQSVVRGLDVSDNQQLSPNIAAPEIVVKKIKKLTNNNVLIYFVYDSNKQTDLEKYMNRNKKYNLVFTGLDDVSKKEWSYAFENAFALYITKLEGDIPDNYNEKQISYANSQSNKPPAPAIPGTSKVDITGRDLQKIREIQNIIDLYDIIDGKIKEAIVYKYDFLYKNQNKFFKTNFSVLQLDIDKAINDNKTKINSLNYNNDNVKYYIDSIIFNYLLQNVPNYKWAIAHIIKSFVNSIEIDSRVFDIIKLLNLEKVSIPTSSWTEDGLVMSSVDSYLPPSYPSEDELKFYDEIINKKQEIVNNYKKNKTSYSSKKLF